MKLEKKKHGKRPHAKPQIMGKLQGHSRGFGFVITDKDSKDIYIAPEDIGGAMHNDQVVVRLKDWWRNQDRPEGEIIDVTERANQRVVGTYHRVGRTSSVLPDDQRLTSNILIPREAANGAKSGDKVVVEITRWPENRRAPEGRIQEVLGAKGMPGVDVLSLIRKFDLPDDFPKKVRREVRSVPEEVPVSEIETRYDLRHLPIVTIDGDDAKDLDDAVSIEKLENGGYLLGVHIADVAHYVREGSALDEEAYQRGTSVYLVDRVVPMLPRELSNGICSLNPKVNRLTKSAFMEFDPRGELKAYGLVKSVIRTSERMTYKKVRLILESLGLVERPDDVSPEAYDGIKQYEYLFGEFRLMHELTEILRRRRMKLGSLDFDLPECKVGLDEEGRPVELYRYPRSIADILIEEFMLAANEAVARHLIKLELPGVYRVHEQPDDLKIEALEKSLAALGYPLGHSGKVSPKVLQGLLERVKDKPEERIINTLVLRSLKRARYAPSSLGHFGLAKRFYLHFTSPIRRYPDLLVHRVLEETLPGEGYFHPQGWRPQTRAGELPGPVVIKPRRKPEELEKVVSRLREMVPDIAEQSSAREAMADEAERESVDMKKVEYMVQHLGEVFPGVISGVTPFGVFVELENLVEGLVRVASITDDYYEYVEAPPSLVGERNHRVLRIGEPVQVQVARVSVEERLIDFVLVEDQEPKRGDKGGKRREKRSHKGRGRKPKGKARL
ncbi:MAG: ribonuclease R [Firmicutes bacterium]|nr:ribonuclease R [Bacillota bacterium]